MCVQYGEDSLDVTKSQYLKAERLEDLAANMGSTHRPALIQAAQAFTDIKAVFPIRIRLLTDSDPNP